MTPPNGTISVGVGNALRVSATDFYENTMRDAGVIHATNATVSITDGSHFEGNNGDFAGAVLVRGSSGVLEVHDATFVNNGGAAPGGAWPTAGRSTSRAG